MTALDATRAQDKAAMRAAMRAARRRHRGGAVTLPPPLLARLIGPAASDDGAPRPRIIATYLPMDDEADPAPLNAAALAHGWQLALPHVTTRDAPMRFLLWAEGAPLADGPFGLRQPRADAPVARPDIILTPLIAFDAALGRLGQGAGFYDRAFAEMPHVLRIGIAWSVQQVPKVPLDRWDVPLHGIVTDKGWIGPDTL